MPYSYVQYTGTGTAPLLSVPFPYLLKAHVRLYTGYDLLTDTWTAELTDGAGFTWTSATQVQLSSNLANGVVLTIIRKTPTNARLVDWNDASNLLAGDMDTADLQTLYAVQEQQDRVTQAAAIADAANDAVADVLLYAPIANVASIPGSPANGDRIELADSTGIESFSPLSGRPVGFVGSNQLRVRMYWNVATSSWVWVSYYTVDPDGRYVRQSSISNSVSSTSQATVASSLAVKTAKDAADAAAAAATAAAAAAATAQSTADATVTTAKLGDGAVTTPKLGDGAVTTPKLADGAVTASKMAAGVLPTIAGRSDINGVHTTGSITSGTTSLTVASATGIVAGMAVTGQGIVPGTTVSSIAGTTVTLSANAGATLSSDPVSFYDNAKSLSPGSVGGQLCSAWANFNGTTSPIDIRASYNVSSITDGGIGIYTVNFTTNVPLDYAPFASSAGGSNSGAATTASTVYGVYATSGFDIQITYSNGSAYVDPTYCSAAAFR